jgi:tripartite-type tricarboxylate transporter receptor subunit TctC
MRLIRTLAVAALCALASAPASAQDYPNRTVRIIVSFPAGGPNDILARIIGQRLQEAWGQPVVIENRPGGNTSIGAQAAAKAAPDGYTLFSAMDTTLVMNPATTPNLPYDPFKDFTWITLISKGSSLLMVREDGPKTVQELMAKGRANPGKLNYGAGILTTRLAGYLFSRESGMNAQLIPYKGSSDVVQGLLTGAVDFIVDGTASSLPLIQQGKFRALAKLTNRALPALPDVPPLAQAANMPAVDEISSWTAMISPAGTPRPIVEKIRAEIVKIYEDPALQERLERAGIFPVVSTPEELEDFFRQEAVRWARVFKESNINLSD